MFLISSNSEKASRSQKVKERELLTLYLLQDRDIAEAMRIWVPGEDGGNYHYYLSQGWPWANSQSKQQLFLERQEKFRGTAEKFDQTQ